MLKTRRRAASFIWSTQAEAEAWKKLVEYTMATFMRGKKKHRIRRKMKKSFSKL